MDLLRLTLPSTQCLQLITYKQTFLSGSECLLFLSVDVFDLALSDSLLQENEDTTAENGINPELAKVGSAHATCLDDTDFQIKE